jgi:hypothetical protein
MAVSAIGWTIVLHEGPRLRSFIGLARAALHGLVGRLSVFRSGNTKTVAQPAEMTFTDSRPIGGAHVLDGLWRRLGIPTAIGAALVGRWVEADRVERILFAVTAGRALKPSGTLAATGWITHDVHIDGLGEVGRRGLLPGD